ncbi:MAG: hypothetical protein JRN52_07105 [Nitrososphaerota archaeon]|nr:hypothetical protein [Nitrososphaerota archaeon]
MKENKIEDIVAQVIQIVNKRPSYFYDVLKELQTVEYRSILLAWSKLREEGKLERDEKGKYVVGIGRKDAV